MSFEINAFKTATQDHYRLLLDADPSREAISRYLEHSFCFEARRGDTLLGVLVLLPIRPETVEIANIAVAERYQNQGLGKELLKFAVKWAGEHGHKVIEVGTGSTSFAQLYLYQKFGFRVIGVEQDFFLKHYNEPIIENKIRLRDMLRLRLLIV